GELLRADLPHATGALFEAPVRGFVLGLVSTVLGRRRDRVVDDVPAGRVPRREAYHEGDPENTSGARHPRSLQPAPRDPRAVRRRSSRRSNTTFVDTTARRPG